MPSYSITTALRFVTQYSNCVSALFQHFFTCHVFCDNENKKITVNFERVLDTVKISGIRVIPDKTINRDMEFSIHACRERCV